MSGAKRRVTEPLNSDIGEPPSPCVRNCCLDEADVCLGCHRSLKEICAWREAPPEEKVQILIRSRQRYTERMRAITARLDAETKSAR